MAVTDFAQEVNPSNFKGYEQQGVVDRSAGIKAGMVGDLVATGLKTGLDAYKGKVLADTENNQEALITEYMNRRSQTPFTQADRDAIHPVLKEHLGDIADLQVAYEQGAMTKDEFQARMISITKDSVNNAPGFYPDIVEHTRKVMELSGINGVIENDVKVDKQKQEQANFVRDHLVSMANTYGIDFDIGQINSPLYQSSLQDRINTAKKEQFALNIFKNKRENEKYATEQEKELFVTDYLPLAVNALLKDFHGNLGMPLDGEDVSELTGVKFATWKKNALLLAESEKQSLNAALGAHLDDARVKTQYENTVKTIDETVKALTDFTGGADAAKYIKTKREMFDDEGHLRFFQSMGMSPEQANLTVQVLGSANLSYLISNNSITKEQITSLIGAVSRGVSGGSKQAGFTETLKSATVENSPEAPKFISSALSLFLKDSNDPTKFSAGDKFKKQTDIVKLLAQPEGKDNISKLDAMGRLDGWKIISDYSTTTLIAASKQFDDLNKAGFEVHLDTLDDGTLVVTGTASRDSTNPYVSRINDSIKATANLMGISTKEAADKYIYPQIFTRIESGQTSQQQPKELTTEEWMNQGNGKSLLSTTTPTPSNVSLQVSPDVQQERDLKSAKILLTEYKGNKDAIKSDIADVEAQLSKKHNSYETKAVLNQELKKLKLALTLGN